MISLAISCQTVTAQDVTLKIDSMMRALADSSKFSGSVLVSDGDAVVYKRAYGYSDLGRNKRNNTSTKFRIGSLTKQFTALLIMQLVEEGRVSLDDKVTQYLPVLSLNTTATIKQLLHQTSGITDYTEMEACIPAINKPSVTPWLLADCFNLLEEEFTPGTQFSYSNTNYYLLGLVIEKVTNKSFGAVLNEKILRPLKMKNTGYITSRSKGFAKGYGLAGNNLVESTIIDYDIAYAAGGMYSTVEDLYKWHTSLTTDKLLTQESLEQIFAQNDEVDPSYYGFGWFVEDNYWKFETSRAFHEGGIDGFSACIDRYPAEGICIVVLSNFEFVESRVDVADPIAQIIFDSKAN